MVDAATPTRHRPNARREGRPAREAGTQRARPPTPKPWAPAGKLRRSWETRRPATLGGIRAGPSAPQIRPGRTRRAGLWASLVPEVGLPELLTRDGY
jgi:hypothetical protein